MTAESRETSLEYDIANGCALVRVPESRVGRDAVLDALLTLIDRAYVFVAASDGDTLVAKLQPRSEATEEQLDALVEEFAGSIAHFALHRQVLDSSGAIRDYSNLIGWKFLVRNGFLPKRIVDQSEI